MKWIGIALTAIFLSITPASAVEPPTGDTLDHGLWWLYHLQYDKARTDFDLYISSQPKDPAGYFYLTAAGWWHLAQDIEYSLPEVQKQLESDSLRTIKIARALYDSSNDPKIQARACLYWGGAEGLRGRWLVTQGQWVKAYFAGKRGYRRLKEAVDKDPGLYDAYLGLGIYDYYTDTLSGAKAVLAALLIRGDKTRGLQELRIAIDKSEHARVEAMCFLIEIYTIEEKTPEKALLLATALHEEFPRSPAMHLLEVSTLYSMKAWDRMLPTAQDFLERSEQEMPWYTRHFTLPARYCIGVGKLLGKRDIEGAYADMQAILKEGKDESRWVSYAYLRRGQIEDLRDDRESALRDYRTVLMRPDLWGSHDEAQACIKNPFTF